MRYTAPGDLVLDQPDYPSGAGIHVCLRGIRVCALPRRNSGMMGSGTTLVECKLLGRRAVGVDINPDAVMVARNRLDFSYAPLDADYVAPEIRTYAGDARSLDLIGSETIDHDK